MDARATFAVMIMFLLIVAGVGRTYLFAPPVSETEFTYVDDLEREIKS